jgi:hypothetical protein
MPSGREVGGHGLFMSPHGGEGRRSGSPSQRYTIDDQNAIRADGYAQAYRVIVGTPPRPPLGAFDEADLRRVEAHVLHFLRIFLNASQSAAEKSRPPERAELPSVRTDAKRWAHLDRFHHALEADRKTAQCHGMLTQVAPLKLVFVAYVVGLLTPCAPTK